MRRRLQRVFAGSLGVGLVLAQHVQAQALPDLLKGRWAFEGGDCKAGVTLQLSGNLLRLTDAAGHVDSQRVTSRRSTGIATQTTASTHGQPVGKAWVYEVVAPGQISLTEGSTGRSTDLTRCPDMLPADATPRQIIEAIYARYAASDDPNLPLSSEANARAFFVPDLADKIVAFASHTGRLADDCKPADPFVPGSFGEYKITQLRVDVPTIPAGADHATAGVALSNLGKPVTLSVLMDRTPAGWRIADVTSEVGQSFRANMAACAGPAK